ncbi:MAG TPA: hypothetical protein VFX16_03205 [Pseudonocardiaceae bacterium]|nr:hypothetical protein [Pseudonocardiaceae bacterium]
MTEWFTPDHKPTATFLLYINGTIYARASWEAEIEIGIFIFTILKIHKSGLTPAIRVGRCAAVVAVSSDPDKGFIARAVLGCL